MSDLDLPVVDLRALDGAPDDRVRFVQELGSSLQTYGFVAVTGHGIPSDVIDAAYAQATALFSLPAEVKAAYEHPATGRQRGYTGFNVEHAKDSDVYDLKEFWQVGRELPADHPLLTSGTLLPNVWPAELPAFRATLSDLFARMDAFSRALLRAICQHGGLDADGLDAAVADGNSVMRVIGYPPVPVDAPPGAVRAAAHEDINLLTVLPTSTQPGLELWDRAAGTWRSLITPPGVMICDTGDIMQRLSSGVFPATTHRVVNPPGSANVARLSMPFFCHPRPDWVIQPLRGDAEPITAGEFLRQRLVAIGVL